MHFLMNMISVSVLVKDEIGIPLAEQHWRWKLAYWIIWEAFTFVCSWWEALHYERMLGIPNL